MVFKSIILNIQVIKLEKETIFWEILHFEEKISRNISIMKFQI